MSVNQSPIHIIRPKIGFSRPTVANTASDGSGTLDTLFIAGANGSLVNQICFTNSQPISSGSTASVVRVFLTDTSGNNPRLLEEVSINSITRTDSVIGSKNINFLKDGLWIASGQIIKCCISFYDLNSQVDIIAEGGDF